LCALAVLVYLATLGKEGLKELARINFSKGEYAKKRLGELGRLRFSGPTFNEFVVTLDQDPQFILPKLLQQGIIGGFPLKKFYPEMEREVLVCVTEKNSRENIDRWVEVLGNVLKEAK
jgi:glycine dehydrogenase subunit 1